jgi:hypothetical protein
MRCVSNATPPRSRNRPLVLTRVLPPSDLRVDFGEPTNPHPTPPLCLAPALLTRARHLPGSDVPSPIVNVTPPRCSALSSWMTH